ncbi:PAS domain S-box-containing protein/diguanylate cyclase (GGDEF) domain-containing protein [Natronincola peptidivorans]|uniref:PAS domain S-box-containing protein/diguanylate cyclase (GGDEF) domain-containing protein n=1 Tax=Natronincola peptidivorans TaxID=426128 RepID=A0A1I0DY48_9FIRM|nr:HD domain-containing phosphohydrolase [Natronincola peptidivorans]SET37600.1 PAS domain S-box-containing protein/diguanylate cyclase (GGDEF) domain-containing protein [Natronincola peptidivorans]
MKKHIDKMTDQEIELREKILGLGEKSFRKNYYPELQSRKEKLESILYTVPVGIGIMMNGVMEDTNDALSNITEYSKEELVGKNLKIFYASEKEYEEAGLRNHQQFARKEIHTIETKWQQKSGGFITILLSFSPLDEETPAKGLTFTVVDISERKQWENALHLEKERLRITLHSIGDGVIATDKDGRVVMLNSVAEELTGWSQQDAQGREMREVFNIVNEYTRVPCENPVKKVLTTGKTIGLANHTTLIAKNGIERAIADSAAPIRDKDGEIQGVVLVFRDQTEERQRQEEIIRLSYYDKLTGLYNRSFFEEELKRLDTERQLPLSIIIGDINGLKLTNDVFGHQEGDRILQSAAKIIKDSCRAEDIVARWGGDEFIVLLPRTSEDQAKSICHRINLQCENQEEYTIKTSISLGYASKEKPQQDIMQLLKKAEDFMYQHKLLESRSLRSAIVSSIKRTLWEKSHETEEHAERLKYYCKKTGIAMGLSEMQLYQLELLAVLHDIGKIAIKDHILNKPGKLTEEEWREIRRHPEIGYRIAQSAPELTQIAEYILTHHERWDGSGYPSNIKGKSIPLLSRILAVVDAYDAMTNHRSYQKALPKEIAIQELLDNAGTQFDPEIVKIFLEQVLKEEKVDKEE